MADFDILFRYLPLRISRAIHLLPEGVFGSVNEIRLRRHFPASLTAGVKNIMFDEHGRICNANNALVATDAEINECVSKLTGGSLYTCDEYLSMGFIPLPEGGRAGICGRANIRNGNINGFSEIYSVDLRLHRFVADFALPLINEYRSRPLCGALVCSPPAIGKTTFLRSAAYLLATGKIIPCKRVGIADERNEIAVGLNGCGLIDILSGAPKSVAITMLTRTMAPELIICDEIGPNETDSLIEAQNTGVALIASAHCFSPCELLKRGNMAKLLQSGIFPLCVMLEYDNGYKCTVSETEAFL